MSQQANRFDKTAATWDDNPIRLAMTKAVARKIQERITLSNTMKALEIGCGTGLVTARLAPYLGSLTALDSSGSMLAELKKKIEPLDLSNVSPVITDLETQDIPGDDYDLAFSNMTFHHIKDGLALLEKVFRSLAPGGKIAITDLDSEDGYFHNDMEGVQYLGFARGDIVTLFEKAGFTNCTIEEAHTLTKKNAKGELATYSLFLATGTKPIQ